MKRFLAIAKSQTIKDSFIVFVGLVATAGLGFLYTVIMARILEPSQFGVFSAIFALVAIAFSLGDLGIGPAIINFLPKAEKYKKEILVTSFWFQYFVAFVFLVIFWILSLGADSLIPGSTSEHFLLIGSLAFNYILIGWAQSVFTAERNFGYITISQIIDASLKIIIVYLLLKTRNLNISTAMLANCISATLALLITTWRRLYKYNFVFDKTLFVQLFSYSKWIALSRFFSVFTSRIDIILLNLLSSGFQSGIYSAASRVTLLFAIIVSGLGSVANPRFSHFTKKSQLLSYLKKLLVLVTALVGFILICVSLASPIIKITFGSSYLEAITVFQLLSVSMVPFLYSTIFVGVILYVYNDSRFYALSTALQFAIIIILDLILIPHTGSLGPVIASGVSNLFMFAFTGYKLTNLLKEHQLPKNIVLKDTI